MTQEILLSLSAKWQIREIDMGNRIFKIQYSIFLVQKNSWLPAMNL